MRDLIGTYSDKFKIIGNEYEPLSILEDMGHIFLEKIGDKDIELVFDIDKGLPAKLYGADIQIRQVINSLVDNAIKYTEQGYIRLLIKIYPEKEDGVINMYVSVKDTGIGIHSKNIYALFRRRLLKRRPSRKDANQGLPSSQNLIGKMGGKINVKSEEGIGSEFWFSVRQGVVDPTAAAALRIPEGGRTPRVSAKCNNSYREEALMTMINAYKLSFIPFDILQDVGMTVDYLFTDFESYQDLKQEMVELVRKKEDICIIENPVGGRTKPEGVTTVYSPFFSLNFCRFLNHEEI